ncbi:MAG TPA: hypothetical protein VFE96_00820 [Candidatus Bathyarchaeia archaeon]|nr:hypothetical protein [Candidatus Bathyarchaeia archaeon]
MRSLLLPLIAGLLIVAILNVPVHGLNETYTFTTSVARLQESTSGRVLLILNVSNANTALNYQFTWHVQDPSGVATQANNATNAPHAVSFVESSAYPARFGASANLAYAGIYYVWVNQTQPPIVGSTGVASGQFQVGLTDGLSYQRLTPVSIMAVGYAPNLVVTIKVSGPGGIVTGFPLNKTADNNGVLTYLWPSIPASLPVGSYTVTLTGNPVKNPEDVQSLSVTATNVTISSLAVTRNALQTSQTEDFRFSASYPNSATVRTGSVSLHLFEADSTTSHFVPMSYSSTLGMFHGTYQIPLSGQVGTWIGIIEANSFDDGYGNKGPGSSVPKAFTVSPAVLAVSATTDSSNYAVGSIVVISAKIVTPGGYNFTSGSVTATTYHSSNMIGSPLSLFYDQSRGKWVGSYMVNWTNPAGIWQIQVNASDIYGNGGEGTTSTLVSIPTAPQQSSTFNYLVIVTFAVAVGLTILGSWIAFGRRRITRRVLKVDLEAVHAEAKKVENQEFFKKVQEQLKQEKETTGTSEHKV